MNDRSVSLLENYDIEVLRTWKGRGAILCETPQGLLILKEYAGHKEKAAFQNALLNMVTENNFKNVEHLLKNKEQELLTRDQDGIYYVLKTYFEGRECNVRDMNECSLAMNALASFHNATRTDAPFPGAYVSRPAHVEFERHNKELRRVRKYLKDRSQKTDFEIYLMQCYDYFFNLALQITEELRFYQNEALHERESLHEGKACFVCHGDFQHHNIMVCENGIHLVNFEKCAFDSPVRDLYLFMRKLLEKNNWDEKIGFELVDSYDKIRPMEKEEYRQLFYRLSYPEKFWKIVNFYYNSGKAWIPGKNLEKLKKVIGQEKDKQAFLEKFKARYDLS